nr:hypothetical protein [Desulfosoma caldarium]
MQMHEAGYIVDVQNNLTQITAANWTQLARAGDLVGSRVSSKAAHVGDALALLQHPLAFTVTVLCTDEIGQVSCDPKDDRAAIDSNAVEMSLGRVFAAVPPPACCAKLGLFFRLEGQRERAPINRREAVGAANVCHGHGKQFVLSAAHTLARCLVDHDEVAIKVMGKDSISEI